MKSKEELIKDLEKYKSEHVNLKSIFNELDNQISNLRFVRYTIDDKIRGLYHLIKDTEEQLKHYNLFNSSVKLTKQLVIDLSNIDYEDNTIEGITDEIESILKKHSEKIES